MRNLTFVLAPDSFKGSMTAQEVCDAMEKGIRKVLPEATCIKIPMADGGEGTVQSLVDATKGQIFELEVMGPLSFPVQAQYGILGDEKIAVIEMASASGIQYINEKTRNPLITTTYGTGQLIKECLKKGVSKIILGIGGSATNDGGAGLAQALGARFLDKHNNELPLGGAALSQLEKIDLSNLDTRLSNVEIEVACDVTNPLCGETGASRVFGPQKGATTDMVDILDDALCHYAEIIKCQLGKDISNIPGAGAAGGLGAGLLAFTNAKLERGVNIVINYTNLREIIQKADFVFTGEGGIDFQTQYGKTPYGVAQVAKSENKRVIAIAGYIGKGIDQLYNCGFDAILGILPQATSLDDALSTGKENVERTIENVVRILLLR